MSELQSLIRDLYVLAKQGQWTRVLAAWESSPVLLRRSSRYIHPESGWSFLHQAAYFGQQQASSQLIGAGAAIAITDRQGRDPAAIAAAHSHHALAEWLRRDAWSGNNAWAPPLDPDVLPSSCRWAQARRSNAQVDLYVAYGGALVTIPRGSTFYFDAHGRVLIGWHGSFDPPCGMDGTPMVRLA